MNYDKPVSIRISDNEKESLRDVGRGSIAEGVRKLLVEHQESSTTDKGIQKIKKIENEIQELKNSPFGLTKEEKKSIKLMEARLEKAKLSYNTKKVNSINEQLDKLFVVND